MIKIRSWKQLKVVEKVVESYRITKDRKGMNTAPCSVLSIRERTERTLFIGFVSELATYFSKGGHY